MQNKNDKSLNICQLMTVIVEKLSLMINEFLDLSHVGYSRSLFESYLRRTLPRNYYLISFGDLEIFVILNVNALIYSISKRTVAFSPILGCSRMFRHSFEEKYNFI